MDHSETVAGSNVLQGVSIHAGFPNPAADRQGAPLKLDQLLIQHPSSTYVFRIVGSNWEGQGIFAGDLALIDRALSPRPDDLALTWEAEHFVLTRFDKLPGIDPWGIVTAIIHPRKQAA